MKMEISMNKAVRFVRRMIVNAVTDAGLFVFVSFMMAFFSSMDPFLLTREELSLLRQYVFIPWGAALCIYRMQRANERNLKTRAEVGALFVLWLWLVVPFALRFGFPARAVGGWHSYGVMFFAIYALVSEEERKRREAAFDHVTLLFAVLGWILGVTLLYCAVTAKSFMTEFGSFSYGVHQDMHLTSGHYYNTTALIGLYTALMCLAGMSRSKCARSRLLYAVPAVMMSVVTILTQSRTARYALLTALALGTYGVASCLLKGRRLLVRQFCALALGTVVLVGGYFGADYLTEKALVHFATHETKTNMLTLIAPAVAEEAEPEMQAEEVDVDDLKRGFGDATFTGRTKIWKNAIAIWKGTPRYMFIGVGAGNSGMLLAKNFWAFEQIGGVEAHNACLQFAVDYGIIALALIFAFSGLVFGPALRVFCRDDWRSGYGVMAMLVAAVMLVGLMESDPLAGLTLSSTLLFFALAMLAARGRELKQAENEKE
ncbi:MAG: O-antigen ligase family protein [Clostridia bacterium]|nr:O-antigen ligase family protein [Clostridia bacterium]